MTEGILSRQNIIFKSALILTGIVYSFFLRYEIIILLMLINIFYFLFETRLLRLWIRTINKVSSFVMSYLIFAFILNIDFLTQMNFLVRIIYLLQLSIYFTQSSKLSNTISDCRNFLKYRLFYYLFYFLLTLSTWMNILKSVWNHQGEIYKKNNQTDRIALPDFLNLIVNTLDESSAKIHIIEKQSNRIMKKPIERRPFLTLANLLLMYHFTLYILVISL